MNSVEGSLNALNAAIAKCRAKDKTRLREIAGQVSARLELLKHPSVPEQIAQELSRFLRHRLSELYAEVPAPALQVASAIFTSVYQEQILLAIGNAQQEQKDRWEFVLHALLSGVLDFFDRCSTKTLKDAIGTELFPTLGDMCFSLTAPMTSVDLRCTAYSILSDAAALHQDNQSKLRDTKILGGERLGSCIWRTKDYLALEGLLNLFARALPSTNNSAIGRTRRTSFIHSVFKKSAPPEVATIGAEIAKLLEYVPTSDWDETSVKIVDTLAKGNITYPQPFVVDGVTVDGESYPSDRLYADDKTLLVDVVLKDDQYESLEIPYSTITQIFNDRDPGTQAQVTLSLRSPPRLGKAFIDARGSNTSLDATFSLQNDQTDRFLRVLDSRSLTHLVRGLSASLPKLSLAVEAANLELDSVGRLVKEPSQSERIENLSQFYRTDEASDDILSAGDAQEFGVAVELTHRSFENSRSVAGNSEEAQVDDTRQDREVTAKRSTSVGVPLARTASEILHDIAFGSSDDDLSDISECDSPLPTSKVLRRTSTSTSTRGRISFEPMSRATNSSSLVRLVRGGVGNMVLDADDSSPVAPSGRSGLSKKVLIREATADTVFADPAATPTLALVASGSAMLAAPTLTASTTSGPCPGNEKVLRFSDVEIPAPDFYAALSSPPIVPKSTLKSALAKKPRTRIADQEALLDSSPLHDVPTVVMSTRSTESAVSKLDDAFNDLAPLSSSPTPGANKSIKAGFRKKHEGARDNPAIKSAKRKLLALDEDEDAHLLPLKDAARSAKRVRSDTVDIVSEALNDDRLTVVPPEARPSPQAPRQSMRVRKRYRARKGQTSSPVDDFSPKQKGLVDYDSLPGPRSSTVLAVVIERPPSPSLEAKNKNTKRETTSKTKDNKVAMPANAEKAKKAKKTNTATKSEKAANAEDSSRTTERILDKSANSAPRVPPRPRSRNVGAGLQQLATTENTGNIANDRETALAGVRVPASAKSTEQARRSRPDEMKTEKTILVLVDIDGVKNADAVGSHVADNLPRKVIEPLPLDSIHAPQVELMLSDPPGSKMASTTQVQSIGRKLPKPDGKRPISGKKPKKIPQDIVANFTPAETTYKEAVIGSPLRSVDEIIDLINVDNDTTDTVPTLFDDTTLLDLPSSVDSGTKDAQEIDQLGTLTREIVKPSIVQVPLSHKAPSNVSMSPIMVKPVLAQVKSKPETIDLTADSPPQITKHTTMQPRQSSRIHDLPEVPVLEATEEMHPHGHSSDADTSAHTRQYLPELNPDLSSQTRPGVRFASRDSVHSDMTVHVDTHQNRSRLLASRGRALWTEQDAAKRITRGTRLRQEIIADSADIMSHDDSGDPGMHAIVSVLDQIHQVIVQNIANKFEGVQNDARASRNELLRQAAADMHAIRGESVAQFNKLVDLEAEYATAGRKLIHGTEDWLKVNQETCQDIAAALERHDQSMLSKRMPATLLPLKL